MSRSVVQVILPTKALVGENFEIRRTLPVPKLRDADPFLMLDHFGPFYQAPNGAGGVGPHPHKGFETVTYLLEGYIGHRDSTGAAADIGPGELQWMTAGSGIVHAERPPKHFEESGGTVHGTQLWVNLAAKNKNVKPRHQELHKKDVPTISLPNGVMVRVLAGAYENKKSPIDLYTDVLLLHVTVPKGQSTSIPLHYPMVISQVLVGEGDFGPDKVHAADGQLVQWSKEVGNIEISVPTHAANALELYIMAGTPLNEPIVSYGPFVMNTSQEIHQAIRDYNEGKMGFLEE